MLLPRTLKCLNSILYPSSQFASLLCKFGIFLHLYPKFSFLFFFILCNCTCVSLCLYLLCIFFLFIPQITIFVSTVHLEWSGDKGSIQISEFIFVHLFRWEYCCQLPSEPDYGILTLLFYHAYHRFCERRFVENHLLSGSIIQISQPT